MNKIPLNIAGLDGGVIIKNGGGGGGVTINNQEKSVDITENGTTEVVADAGFTGLSKVIVNTNVASSGGGSGWTGHADAEGLRAIGWTDEDIAYYQEHGVNWNAEDDEYHKVTDDNKALYGVLTADNIGDYFDRIVYLPKIDTSAITTMRAMFYNFRCLIAIPKLDTSKVTDMSNMFYGCSALVCVPLLDTSQVTNMNDMFDYCYTLVYVPLLNISNVTSMQYMFADCMSLVDAPKFNTSKVTNMTGMFYNCRTLAAVSSFDVANEVNMDSVFTNCYSICHAYIKNVKCNLFLIDSSLLSKSSLLYIINNEAATSAITITLHSYAYTRLANDADIVAALANHPNISISQ